jgi:hypothetical protein
MHLVYNNIYNEYLVLEDSNELDKVKFNNIKQE